MLRRTSVYTLRIQDADNELLDNLVAAAKARGLAVSRVSLIGSSEGVIAWRQESQDNTAIGNALAILTPMNRLRIRDYVLETGVGVNRRVVA